MKSEKLERLNKILDMNISEITVEFGSAAEIREILSQSMEMITTIANDFLCLSVYTVLTYEPSTFTSIDISQFMITQVNQS